MAQRIVDGYEDPPTIQYNHAYPCYQPASDRVRMPATERFISEAEMYSTLLHELAHSTGSQHRLNRSLERSATFGSKPYGKEELVAEMAAAFLCAEAGIGPATLENTAAYIQGWLKQLRNDRRLIVHAAGAAQKAADWILGRRPAAAPHHEPAPARSAPSHT